MKLQLKHLAPYLPYGLKVKKDADKLISEVKGLESSKHKDYFWIKYEKPTKIAKLYLTETSSILKPILRPLSDLTKEIDHNGKKFVPMKVFYELFGGGYMSYKGFINCQLPDFNMPLIGLRYDIIQQLLEWHFDIFGLIENGLAIDKKTIS